MNKDTKNMTNANNEEEVEVKVNNITPRNRRTMWIIIAAAVVVLFAGLFAAYSHIQSQRAIEAAEAEKEQILLDVAQKELEEDYDALNEGFAQFENSRQYIMDDSVKRELTQKYEAARLQVEKLQQELNNQKHKSVAEINKLKDEISTLRALLRHYVEEIDRLNKENEALRTENTEIKTENQKLNTQVAETSRRNEVLSERMTLAEKLNVTGVKLTALNKKGKTEKKVEKAVQLMVTFTIPQNNSTPVGNKTIYMRLISPTGQLLGGAGTFPFEGGNVACSAKKVVEYAGEEISGITIYWDVNTALTSGDYTVELFADNYRLASRSFNLN
jgi:cell division protein FtsB